VYHRLGLVEL